ncbi:MAG: hypothetical protein ABSH51_03630 [Solirubrobacteraceae bacterium]|jgi:hypothetical protein
MTPHRFPHLVTRRALGLALATTAAVLPAGAVALAAAPTAGARFTGTTSQAKFNGFSSTVTFSVSGDRSKLLHFTFESQGCAGSTGLTAGVNYLRQAQNTYPMGSVPVSSGGKFTVKNARYLYKQKGYTTLVNTATISGSFQSATKATGTIAFKQTGLGTCAPPKFSFTATAA